MARSMSAHDGRDQDFILASHRSFFQRFEILAENGERDNTSVAMRFCAASDFCAVGLLAFAMHGK